jgi:hypothetical protein
MSAGILYRDVLAFILAGTDMRQVYKVRSSADGGARRVSKACFQEFGERLQIERGALAILAPGIGKP